MSTHIEFESSLNILEIEKEYCGQQLLAASLVWRKKQHTLSV